MMRTCFCVLVFLFSILDNRVPSRLISSDEVSFELDVQPILASKGCNSGACHGKQGGQNGFQLSLLGFDSDFDYSAITRESRGRRVFPAAPEKSLLLQKAIAEVPHGGGKRIQKNSENYDVLKQWLIQGRKRKAENETTLQRISLNRTDELLAPGEKQQLTVTAHYANGSKRTVTGVSTFQSNDPAIVSVDPKGGIIAGNLPGETAIMARYMNNIEVCHVAIPLQKKIDPKIYQQLPRFNFIDDLVWKKLKRLNIKPSGPTGDAKYMRRVYTDIIGRLPTGSEARSFLEDSRKGKRQRLVDHLLEMPEYAEFSANKWADLLRTNPYRVGIKTTLNYDYWIRQQFRNNVAYDEFARSLITARGSTFRNGAVTMFRDRRSPDELTTIVTQLFLGIRLECAKCHHHPFEKWSQEDFYGFAAYFANVSRKGTGLSPPISGSEEIILETGTTKVSHPTTGKVLSPRPLFGDHLVPDELSPKELMESSKAPRSLRESLADWVTSKENHFFAQVQVNRVWADLMGRGIVEPVDDLRATNPPSNQELLEALAKDFQEHDFDLKQLIRTICSSYAYGLSSIPHPNNVSDRLNYSRHYRHRLRAETLIDSLAAITGVDSKFSATPAGTRAVEIWTHRTQSLFLDTFGRPNPNEDPPCERTRELTVTQSLHLMNAKDMHQRLTGSSGTTEKLAKSGEKPEKIAEEIYLMIYNRFPGAEELAFAKSLISGENKGTAGKGPKNKEDNLQKKDNQVAKPRTLKQRIEDLMWGMINTPEFSIQD